MRSGIGGRADPRCTPPGGCPHRPVGKGQAPATFLSAAEAVEYGILDEVCRPDAPDRRLPGGEPPPMGFRPLR